MYTKGETIPNFYRGGLKEGVVKVAPYGAEGLRRPRASTPTTSRPSSSPAATSIFKGPLKDNKGNTVIAAGVDRGQTDRRAREDELSGRRRHRRDVVTADALAGRRPAAPSRLAEESSGCELRDDTPIRGGSPDRRRVHQLRCAITERSAARRNTSSSPRWRSSAALVAVRHLRRAVRQEPARPLFLHVPGRVRHLVLLAEHAERARRR